MREAPGATVSDQRGSALLLVPAATLVMVLLASIAVDRSIVVTEQRNLVTVAQGAAADAVAIGIDQRALHQTGALAYDRARIDRAVRLAVHLEAPDATVTWRLDGDVIEVRVARDVRLVFAPAITGAPRRQRVHATASAHLRIQTPADP